jgi:drug/metabolite transporter (DMT)-like permease
MMTEATAYALAAMVCYGLGDVIFKRAARAGVKAHHFLAVQAWLFCPVVVLYALLTHKLAIEATAGWGALAGLLLFVGFYNFVRSLATGAVSVMAPIFRLNFVVTVLLAVVALGEALTAAKLAGLTLALAAVWLLLGGGSKQNATSGRALAQVLVATGAAGAANFFHKVGLAGGSTPETMLAAQAVVFMSCATLFTFHVDGALEPPAATLAHSAPAAFVLIAAFMFFLHGLARGEASVLVPIAQMGFVPAAAAGIVLFREPPTARIAAGLLAAVAALATLAIAAPAS